MTKYKDFKRDIMLRILNMEIEEEESFWPEAIFMEDREGEEIIVYIEDLREISEEENISIENVITDVIKEENPKNLALVFESRYLYADGQETSVLSFLVGNIMDLECYEADYYKSGNVLKLENFEKVHQEDYPNEAIAVRRAMTYQNE